LSLQDRREYWRFPTYPQDRREVRRRYRAKPGAAVERLLAACAKPLYMSGALIVAL
jgi:hypothetical protein